MVIKVYMASLSCNPLQKKHTNQILTTLQGKNIEYEEIDVTDPQKSEGKKFMREHSKSRKEGQNPVPPQLFNEDAYCGDYEDFENSVENDLLYEFLKLATAKEVSTKTLEEEEEKRDKTKDELEKEAEEKGDEEKPADEEKKEEEVKPNDETDTKTSENTQDGDAKESSDASIAKDISASVEESMDAEDSQTEEEKGSLEASQVKTAKSETAATEGVDAKDIDPDIEGTVTLSSGIGATEEQQETAEESLANQVKDSNVAKQTCESSDTAQESED